nr:hypothetical protein DSAG12_02314 [Candidatus Prometheoarchaeum syntrophicum]
MSSSFNSPIWNQTWDGSAYETGTSIWKNESYLYTAGYTNSFGAGSSDLLLIKWNTDGSQIWNRTWGGEGIEVGVTVWGDENFLYTTGYTDSFGAGNFDLFLIKWTTEGNQIWNRTWGGMDDDFVRSLWGDETYLYTTGLTKSFSPAICDLVLIKWTTEGNQIWNRTWGGMDSDIGNTIWGDESFLYTTGYTKSCGKGEGDLLIVKWDTDGTQIWNRTWGGTRLDYVNSAWGSGSYLYLTGYTGSYSTNDYDLFLTKWDIDGNLIWEQILKGFNYDRGKSIWSDGLNLYVLGTLNTLGPNIRDFLLIKWDTDGNQIWNQTWGYPEDDFGYSISGDEIYLYLVGHTKSSFVNEGALFLSKIHKTVLQKPIFQHISPNPDPDGNITLNWNNVADATSYSLYRNTNQIPKISGLAPISVSATTSYSDNNLTNNTYYYVVVAKDEYRKSDISNCELVEVQIVPPIPKEGGISGFPFGSLLSIWSMSIIFLLVKRRK